MFTTRLHILSGYIPFGCPVRQTDYSFWGTNHESTLSNRKRNATILILSLSVADTNKFPRNFSLNFWAWFFNHQPRLASYRSLYRFHIHFAMRSFIYSTFRAQDACKLLHARAHSKNSTFVLFFVLWSPVTKYFSSET